MMKRYLPVVLSVVLVIALAVPAAAGPFTDVPENHWAYEAVKQLTAYGLVVGFPDGEYKGNEPMTRYQMAMVIARMLVSLDAQIKAEVEAAKTVIPAEVPAEAPEKEVVVEQPVIEKVVEKTIVEKLETEQLEALAARVGALDADTKAKFAELEAKIAKGDADNAAAIAALRAELAEKGVPVEVAPEVDVDDAKVAEAIALVDALRAEFVTELDILNARTNCLEGELQLAMEKIDVLDEKVADIDVALSDHLEGHEKVKITGSSTVKFEDVDIKANFPGDENHAWKNPNDIFKKEAANHGKGKSYYKPGTDFKHQLGLTLTAYPADGVTVKAGLATVTNLFTGDFDSGNLEVDGLSLEVTTPGVLERLYAGDLTLPEGTFTPYTFWGDEILDDDDPMYKGVLAELGYDKYSGTLLFTRIEKEAKAVEADPTADPAIEASDANYALYAFAGEGKVAITENLNLSAAYVRAWEDYHSLMIAEEVGEFEQKPMVDSVISLAGDFTFGEGWKVDGEFAKWSREAYEEVEDALDWQEKDATAAKLNLSGVIGPVELAGEYVRVEKDFAPEFVFVDDDDGLEVDVKTIGANAKVVPIENLTLTGSYKITGNAGKENDERVDWENKKHGIAELGAAYELAWGDLTLTPSLNLKHTKYMVDGTGKYGNDGAVLETTAGVEAEFEPIEASFKHVDGRVKGDTFEPYFKRNTLELGADYDITDIFNVHGGYTWDKQEVDAVGLEKKDLHESKFDIGAKADFTVYEGITLNAGYDYEVKNDHLLEYKPWTKSILTAGVEAQVTPKSKIDGKAEYHKLDRFYDGVQYKYAPVTNIIGEVKYAYNITTNTDLNLGYKVIKSDVENETYPEVYDYLARIISGSLKVKF